MSAQNLRFGVDAFTPQKISGWARLIDSETPVDVALVVNGETVGRLRADQFRADLCKMRSDGRFAFMAMPFGNAEWRPRVAEGAIAELRDATTGEILRSVVWDGSGPKGQTGIVDSNGGRLSLSKGVFVVPMSERSESWKQSILSLAAEVAGDAARSGFQLAACYGTLLGAVREGDLIGHDDDVDMMFLSKEGSMLGAVEDFHRLQAALAGLGFTVKELSNGQAHVSRGDDFPVDVFLGWFEQGRLSLTFTVKAQVEEAQILPLGFIGLRGVELPAPRNPEPLLEAIYGPGWKVPDPAFVWQRPREIAEYFAPIHNYRRSANVDYWRDYYGAQNSLSPPRLPSQFALFALSVRPVPGMIVDLGCGSGRDALFFAEQRIPTLGLDYAQTAIDANRLNAEERGLQPHAAFRRVDVSDLADVASAVGHVADTRPAAPLCVYSRFFFHAIDENTEGAALLLVSQLLSREGDYAAFEFRTRADEHRQKVTPAHYRRYVDVDAFLRKAQSVYGLNCVYRVEGTGFAVFRDDDAEVVRLVLVK